MEGKGQRFERETVITFNEEEAVKKCSKCQRSKPVTDFYRRAKNKAGLYYSWCRNCHAQVYQQRRTKDPDKFYKTRINTHYKRRYGVDYDTYEQLCSLQAGLCAICKAKPRKLVVDHDHSTGKVRGLLCRKCNTGLGFIGDSMFSIGRIIRYLTRVQPGRLSRAS